MELRKIPMFGLVPFISVSTEGGGCCRDGEEFSLVHVEFQVPLNHIRCQGSSLECRSEIQERTQLGVQVSIRIQHL